MEVFIKCSFEDLESIEEVGPIVADSIIGFWNDESNKKIANECFSLGVKFKKNYETAIQTLLGKTFVFTGSLKIFTRAEAKQIVEKLGARASNSISKNTDYLVAGPGSGSKLGKAKQLGRKIINEGEFEKLIA